MHLVQQSQKASLNTNTTKKEEETGFHCPEAVYIRCFPPCSEATRIGYKASPLVTDNKASWFGNKNSVGKKAILHIYKKTINSIPYFMCFTHIPLSKK